MEAITNYALVVLLFLVMSLGFTTYIYREDTLRLQDEVVELNAKLKQSEQQTALATKSCEVTQTITKDVSQSIEQKQTVMTKTLEALATVPTTEGRSNDSKYADDASLSPDLMRLLDNAYCGAAKNDPTCTPNGATANVPNGKSVSK